jgi:spermidine synthase
VSADHDRARGYYLSVDGVAQSHVDLDDPTYLEFEYMRWLGHLVDVVAPKGEPLRVVHLGAGALTLARYVAVTRPGSRQRAVDADADVVAAMRERAALPRGVRVPVQIADAREAASRMRPGSADLVVLDVFSGARTPAHLTSVEMVRLVHRLLARSGLVAVNVADGPAPPGRGGRSLGHLRRQVATYASVFREVAVVAEPGVWRGRRFGNLVLIAADRTLPIARLVRRCSGDPLPARVVWADEARRLAVGLPVVTDADSTDSPALPREIFEAL